MTDPTAKDWRDRFAAAALQGILASEAAGDACAPAAITNKGLVRPAELYARVCYELADAMLAERAQPKPVED